MGAEPFFPSSMRRRLSGATAALLCAAVAAPTALAQGMGGGMGGDMGSGAGAPGGAAQAGMSQAPMTGQGGGMGAQASGGMGGGMGGMGGGMGGGAGAPGGSPDALFGLRPTDQPQVLTLDQALTLAAQQSFDLRIAREKVVQQEQQVRKAWAMLLPNISLGGNYTLNCIGDQNAPWLNCSDQTIEFLNEDSLEQQALLFSSIGELVAQAATFEQDPAAQEELRERSRQLFATADGFERQKGEIEPIIVQPAHVVNGNITFSMPLFNGRAIPLLQNAYTAVDAVDLAGTQARAALMLAVARAYYAAFTAKRMLGVAAEQRDSALRHRDATKERVALDAAPILTLRRAELDVIRAEQSVRTTEAGYRLAVGAVGNLIGVPTFFEVVEPPPQVPLEGERDADELLQLAYSARYDLKAQRLALTIADRNRTDAWMQFLPSFNLVAQGRATSNVNGFVPTPFTGALMITASLPLYDGGARYATLKESASKIREELLRIKQLEQRVEGQVRGNVSDVELKQQALDLAREALAVAQQARDQAQTLYDVGAATPLDVSDANLAVFVSEMELLRTELEVHQARLGLAYVVGAFPGELSATANALADDEATSARQRVEAVEGP